MEPSSLVSIGFKFEPTAISKFSSKPEILA